MVWFLTSDCTGGVIQVVVRFKSYFWNLLTHDCFYSILKDASIRTTQNYAVVNRKCKSKTSLQGGGRAAPDVSESTLGKASWLKKNWKDMITFRAVHIYWTGFTCKVTGWVHLKPMLMKRWYQVYLIER